MGHRIPLAKQWLQGDCIRGSLHKDTYYGAITQFNRDEVKYVVRKELRPKQGRNDGGFENWNELEDVIVDKSLFNKIKEQVPEGVSFKEAYKEGGFYMLDKNGKRINIRRIRCYVNLKEPLVVRKQAYSSPFAYKNVYYAQNDENVACSLYEHENKRKFRCFTLYNVAKSMRNQQIHNINELLPKSLPKEKGGKKKRIEEYKRLFVLIPGQMVILRGDEESVTTLSPEEISKRYYKVCKIKKDGRILLQHHLEARNDDALNKAYPNEKSGVNGFSKINLDDPYPRLLLSRQNHNFWIEGVDFQIVNGAVKEMK